MTRKEFRVLLEIKLNAEKKHGFKHCITMLEEIITWCDEVDNSKNYKVKKMQRVWR